MSRLSDIPVRVVPPRAPPAGLGGGIGAILSEVAVLLERLAARDETAMIDLHSLPMSAADRSRLRSALGDGEVTATLEAQGISTARETGYAGVWWIEHRDPNGVVLAELLEIARFPQILASAPDEIEAAGRALRAHSLDARAAANCGGEG